MKQTTSVSIVIPVYNEAAHLPACLEAIQRQTVRPFEVIVVDNNSTDNTVAIAKSYDFVTLIREPKQGVVHARDTGFNKAKGAIIGRIDADTVISPNWIDSVQNIFMKDRDLGAVTGRAKYYDMGLSWLMNMVDLRFRYYFARVLGDEVAVQGANMAIRRQVWEDVRSHVCRRGGMHEDFDLAIHTNWCGHKVRFNPSLVASIGYRQAASTFKDFASYAFLSPKTYALHELESRRYMYPVAVLAVACYLPLKLLHQGYDKKAGKFSWTQLFSESVKRVNPATYVE